MKTFNIKSKSAEYKLVITSKSVTLKANGSELCLSEVFKFDSWSEDGTEFKKALISNPSLLLVKRNLLPGHSVG